MIEFLGCKGPRPLIGREQLLVKWRQISRATLYHALLTQASEDKILYVHWSEQVMFILLGDHSGCTNAMKKLAVLTGVVGRDQFDSNAKNGRKMTLSFLVIESTKKRDKKTAVKSTEKKD